MHLLIEGGIRGGVSMISNRMSTANNKYLANFDSSKSSTYIMYRDPNNLYGWAMSEALPYGDFEWVEYTEEVINSILSLPQDSAEGYILEVGLHYPDSLHDHHNDFPLAPEKVKIEEKDLSPYAHNTLRGKFTSRSYEKAASKLIEYEAASEIESTSTDSEVLEKRAVGLTLPKCGNCVEISAALRVILGKLQSLEDKVQINGQLLRQQSKDVYIPQTSDEVPLTTLEELESLNKKIVGEDEFSKLAKVLAYSIRMPQGVSSVG